MNSALKKAFESANTLIPYITFGDPDIAFTRSCCEALLDSGADILEIGLPFSDPIADGEVIQRSHQRALKHTQKVTIKNALTMVAEIKQSYQQPIIFMGSVNLVLQYGVDTFFQDADKVGLAGIIIPDLTIESASAYLKSSKQYNVPIIFLVSPLCDDKRISEIVMQSEGFIYLISTTGITGERHSISADLGLLTKKIKSVKNIPVAVGFGISTPEHVTFVNQVADGAIVGSHLVKIINDNVDNLDNAIQQLSSRVKALKHQ